MTHVYAEIEIDHKGAKMEYRVAGQKTSGAPAKRFASPEEAKAFAEAQLKNGASVTWESKEEYNPRTAMPGHITGHIMIPDAGK